MLHAGACMLAGSAHGVQLPVQMSRDHFVKLGWRDLRAPDRPQRC